ncbi:hypothetical protein [Streptomyces sp. NPDC003077]|uniref:hypothetical protein n=1 Tax=Streptomyces sp. NPDC003077 TaxID=3154443 RepID=UPI00339EE5CA
MDAARVVLDFVKALVWPAVVVFVLLRYRDDVREKILQTKHLATPLATIDFADEVRAVQREAVRMERESEEEAGGEDVEAHMARAGRWFEDLYGVAASHPRVAIVRACEKITAQLAEAAAEVLGTADDARARLAPVAGESPWTLPVRHARVLTEHGWKARWAELTNSLVRLRYRPLGHYVSPESAAEYLESCALLAGAIDAFLAGRRDSGSRASEDR